MAQYATVGIVATVVDFAILNLFVQIFHLNLYLSITAGFLSGWLIAFSLNRRWTFFSEKFIYSKKRQMVYCILLSVIAYFLNLLIVFIGVQYLLINYNWAKLIATVIVFFWNYTMNRFWTFRTNSGGQR